MSWCCGAAGAGCSWCWLQLVLGAAGAGAAAAAAAAAAVLVELVPVDPCSVREVLVNDAQVMIPGAVP